MENFKVPLIVAAIGLFTAGIIAGIGLSFVTDRDSRATIFHPEQLVRVYGPSGNMLFVGKVTQQEIPFITLCDLHKVGIGGNFVTKQCVTLDTRGQYLMIEANEPGVTWHAPR